MEVAIKPNADSWHLIIKSAAFPIFLVILAALAGVHIVEFDTSKFESWFACVSYTALLLATLSEVKEKPQKKNWFINQNTKTGKHTFSVWSLRWLKLWVFISLVVFVFFVLGAIGINGT